MTPLRAFLTLAATTLLAGCGLTDDLSRTNLHPDASFEIVPEDLGLAPESLAIPVDGAVLRAWFFAAPGSDCTLLVCGGNSSNMQLLLPIAQTAVAAGYNVVLFDYRGFGLSTGEPDVFSIVPDSTAVLEAVARHAGTRKLAIYGISLGSVAAVGATSNRPDLVDAILVEALFSPNVQLKKEMGGFAAFLGRALFFPGTWDVESIVPKLPQPMLLVHGDRDGILPIEDSLPIYEEMPGSAGPRFLWVPAGAGHAPGVSARFGPDYAALVTSFLNRSLRGAPAPWFDAAWDDGLVRLTPLFPAGDVPIPVEISAIAADGTPRVVRAWFDPARPAPVPVDWPEPPVFVSAVVPIGVVVGNGTGWIRAGNYVASFSRWDAFRASVATGMERRFLEWKIPADADEALVKATGEQWKREGREGDPRPWLKEQGLLRADTPEGEKRRELAVEACGRADAELREILALPLDAGVRPRFAEQARQIAECWDALGETARGTAVWQLRLDLLPAHPDAWIEFDDASWQIGVDGWAVLAMLRRLDSASSPAAQDWKARCIARKAFLEDWHRRNGASAPPGQQKKPRGFHRGAPVMGGS